MSLVICQQLFLKKIKAYGVAFFQITLITLITLITKGLLP
jgi:hypothetical protein